MKKVVLQLKRTLSTVLALMMVATSVPQAAMTVMAAEDDYAIEYDIPTFKATKVPAVEEVYLNDQLLSAEELEEGVEADATDNTLVVVTNDKNKVATIAGLTADKVEVVKETSDDETSMNKGWIIGRKSTYYSISANDIAETIAIETAIDAIETKTLTVSGLDPYGPAQMKMYGEHVEGSASIDVGSDVYLELVCNDVSKKYSISCNGVDDTDNWETIYLSDYEYVMQSAYIVKDDLALEIFPADDERYVPVVIDSSAVDGIIDYVDFYPYAESGAKVKKGEEIELAAYEGSGYAAHAKRYDISVSVNGVAKPLTETTPYDPDDKALTTKFTVAKDATEAKIEFFNNKVRSGVKATGANVDTYSIAGAKKFDGDDFLYVNDNKSYEITITPQAGYKITKVLNGEDELQPVANKKNTYSVDVATDDITLAVSTEQESFNFKATFSSLFKKLKFSYDQGNGYTTPKSVTNPVNEQISISSNATSVKIEFEKLPNNTAVVVTPAEEEGNVVWNLSKGYLTYNVISGNSANKEFTVETFKTGRTVNVDIAKLSISANDITYKVNDVPMGTLPADKKITGLFEGGEIIFTLDYTGKSEYMPLADPTAEANVYELTYTVTAADKQTVAIDEKVNPKAIYSFKFVADGDSNYVVTAGAGKAAKDITLGTTALPLGENTYTFTVKPVTATDKVTVTSVDSDMVTISQNTVKPEEYTVNFIDEAAKGTEKDIKIKTEEPSGTLKVKYNANHVDVSVVANDVKLTLSSVDDSVRIYNGTLNTTATVVVTAKDGCTFYDAAKKKNVTSLQFNLKFVETPEINEIVSESSETVVVTETATAYKAASVVTVKKDAFDGKIGVAYNVKTGRAGDDTATISENSVVVKNGNDVVTTGYYVNYYPDNFDIDITDRELAGKTLTITYQSICNQDLKVSTKTLTMKTPAVIKTIKIAGKEAQVKAQEAGLEVAYPISISPANAAITVCSVSANGLTVIDQPTIKDGKLYVKTKPLANNATREYQAVITVGDGTKNATITIDNTVPTLNIKKVKAVTAYYDAVVVEVERDKIANFNANANYKYQVSVSVNGVDAGPRVINTYDVSEKNTKQTLEAVIGNTYEGKNVDVWVELIEEVSATTIAKTALVTADKKLTMPGAIYETNLKLKATKAKTVYTDQSNVVIADAQWSKTTTARKLAKVVVTYPDNTTATFTTESALNDVSSFKNGSIALTLNNKVGLQTGKYKITAYADTYAGSNTIPSSASVTVTVVNRNMYLYNAPKTYKPFNKAVQIKFVAYDVAKSVKKDVKSSNKIAWSYSPTMAGVSIDKNGTLTVDKSVMLSAPVTFTVTAALKDATANDKLAPQTATVTITPTKASIGQVIVGTVEGDDFTPVSQMTVGNKYYVAVLKSNVGQKAKYSVANHLEFVDGANCVASITIPKNSGSLRTGDVNDKYLDLVPAKNGKLTITAKDIDGSKQTKKLVVPVNYADNIVKFALESYCGGTYNITQSGLTVDEKRDPFDNRVNFTLKAYDSTDTAIDDALKNSNVEVKASNVKGKLTIDTSTGDVEFYIKDVKKPTVITITDKSKKNGAKFTYTINNNAAWTKLKNAPKITQTRNNVIYAQVSDSSITGNTQLVSLDVTNIPTNSHLYFVSESEYKTRDQLYTLSQLSNVLSAGPVPVVNNKITGLVYNTDGDTCKLAAGTYKFTVYAENYMTDEVVSAPTTVSIKVSNPPKAEGKLVVPSTVKMITTSGNALYEQAELPIKVTNLGNYGPASEKALKFLSKPVVQDAWMTDCSKNPVKNDFSQNFKVIKSSTGYKLVYVGTEDFKTFATNKANAAKLKGYITITVQYGINTDGTVKTETKTFMVKVNPTTK